jgi:hypothetical protein
MNKTLMDKERSMFSSIGLAQELWAGAVDIARYLVNRSHSSTIVDSNQHELWFGKKPSLSNLKVFGCDPFVHVPKEKRNKLEKRQSSVFSLGTRME